MVTYTKRVTNPGTVPLSNISITDDECNPLQYLSGEAVVGKGPMPRSEVVSKMWVYIKGKNLQDPKNKRNIKADAALKKVFGGKDMVNMFEMATLISAHVS